MHLFDLRIHVTKQQLKPLLMKASTEPRNKIKLICVPIDVFDDYHWFR